jgi:hypothetical protein
MRYSVSNTAEYGDYTRGPRIINQQTREEMKKILREIQTGQFAREWILENKAGAPAFKAQRRLHRGQPLEEVGADSAGSCPGSTPRKSPDARTKTYLARREPSGVLLARRYQNETAGASARCASLRGPHPQPPPSISRGWG